MSQMLYVNSDRRDQIIAEAAQRQTPLVLTRREDAGWKVTKARFAGCDQPQQRLFIEQPAGDDEPVAAETGELLGVAFRRGHKKCLFNAVVATCGETSDDRCGCAAPIVLCWPDGLQELQRRVYQRACPPPGRRIKVGFCRAGRDAHSGQEHLGVMEDLSAGGTRVRARSRSGLEIGDPVCIIFALRSRGPEFMLDATFRHCETKPDGVCSLGFQFVSLETSRERQEALVRLARTVTDFQRAALRRQPRKLHSRPSGQ